MLEDVLFYGRILTEEFLGRKASSPTHILNDWDFRGRHVHQGVALIRNACEDVIEHVSLALGQARVVLQHLPNTIKRWVVPVGAFGMLPVEHAKQKVPVNLRRMRDGQERPLVMVKFITLHRACPEVLECVPDRVLAVSPEPFLLFSDVIEAA
jgi:hypothetical protein